MSKTSIWGALGVLIVILAAWGVVHWQADPGAQIGFGAISYTKPTKTFSAQELAQKLSTRLGSTHNMVLTYAEPCGELTLTDTTGKFARFVISTATTLEQETDQGTGRWVIETSAPKHTVALATRVEPSYAVDNPEDGSALSLFNKLKSACSPVN